MGPLPTGPPTKHINKSHGADTNIMKFYVTQNSTTYGKHWQNFNPRKGRHTGTGYLANFRPGVYYNNRIDAHDNPTMSNICARNYCSITKRDFRGYHDHDGGEPLPINTFQNGSGFVRESPITVPKRNEVQQQYISTRVASAPADILPRYKPLLHKLRSKDPVELENQGYGPSYMETETQVRYQGKQDPFPGIDRGHTTIGPLLESGFTHNKNIEPVTYEPGSNFPNDKPGWATHRPLGSATITRTDFVPYRHPDGAEALPNGLAPGADRGSGFVREVAKPTLYLNRVMEDAYNKAGDLPGPSVELTRKRDPTEYFNMIHPNNYSTISMDTYKGQQRPSPSLAERLDRHFVGTKEPSGFVENEPGKVMELDNPRRFITHYMTRYEDPTPGADERVGHIRGNVLPILTDGFTKSTQVHSHGPDFKATATLRRLEPYVARSIKARDQFFDDHTYDSKLQRSITMIA